MEQIMLGLMVMVVACLVWIMPLVTRYMRLEYQRAVALMLARAASQNTVEIFDHTVVGLQRWFPRDDYENLRIFADEAVQRVERER
jgi:uncharacterized membrane protein